MQTEYNIDANDFLAYQLYTASRSKMIRNKRLRNKILVPVVYLAFGLMFILLENDTAAVIFCAIAIIWFFVFPLWERSRYIGYYKKYLNENYKERFGRKVTTRFENDFIYTYDNGNEGKISITEVEEINEIPLLFLVKLKTGQSLIIPKNKIGNLSEIKSGLKDFAVKLSCRYTEEPEWKWR